MRRPGLDGPDVLPAVRQMHGDQPVLLAVPAHGLLQDARLRAVQRHGQGPAHPERPPVLPAVVRVQRDRPAVLLAVHPVQRHVQLLAAVRPVRRQGLDGADVLHPGLRVQQDVRLLCAAAARANPARHATAADRAPRFAPQTRAATRSRSAPTRGTASAAARTRAASRTRRRAARRASTASRNRSTTRSACRTTRRSSPPEK